MTTPRPHYDSAARYFADDTMKCWARNEGSNSEWTLMPDPRFNVPGLVYYVGHEPPPPGLISTSGAGEVGMTDTVDTLRAQLAEQFRELIAKEAERAARELECNNAQRQHTMQCAINKADSQRILELTTENERMRARLAEASQELKELHESRNALIGRDHELTLKWAEAQRDSERLDWMIEQRAYVVSDPDCCDGYWLRYHRKDGTVWVQVTEHETPRAAIDAARTQQEER